MDETVLPPELKEANRQTWLQMIVIAAGLVFVLDLVANFISFSNRFASALTTAILFAVLFGLALYSASGLSTTPTPASPPAGQQLSPPATP